MTPEYARKVAWGHIITGDYIPTFMFVKWVAEQEGLTHQRTAATLDDEEWNTYWARYIIEEEARDER